MGGRGGGGGGGGGRGRRERRGERKTLYPAVKLGILLLVNLRKETEFLTMATCNSPVLYTPRLLVLSTHDVYMR